MRQLQGALLSAPTSSQAPHKGPRGAGLPVASCGLCCFGGGQGSEVQCLLSASQKPHACCWQLVGVVRPLPASPCLSIQGSEPARCRDSCTSVGLLAHLFWNHVRSPQPYSLQPHLVKSVFILKWCEKGWASNLSASRKFGLTLLVNVVFTYFLGEELIVKVEQ